ncbi:MAG: hypothetical protein N3D10_01960 [Candidatus Micrarchaeota archaeon]|nr:hypothetical protein [Candidatus Micrarchaeota archaeon]
MISYQQLCEIYRLEKSTNLLCELPKNFENDIKELIYNLSLKNDQNSAVELYNIKNRLKELFRLRMQKIALAALMVKKVNTELKNELEFFNKLQELVEKQLSWIESIENQKSISQDSITIKILKDIEEYISAKGEPKGPYKKDQVVKTEKEEAEWLIKTGLAVKVD